MRRVPLTLTNAARVAFAVFLLLLPAVVHAQRKRVWNYEGGVWFVTDGGIPNGPCLRIRGHLAAPGFFDGLKRVDDANGTRILRGSEKITEFPEKLFLEFSIRDWLCPPELKPSGDPGILTREVMQALRLSFFWKHGLALRSAEGAKRKKFFLEPREAYASDVTPKPLERFVWNYEFEVHSADVPLTDHLVIVLRTKEGRLVARVAARL